MRRIDVFDKVMAEELEWVSDVRDFTWRRMVLLGDGQLSTTEIRGICLKAGMVGEAFVTERTLNIAHQLPWSLCIGNQLLNLEKLAAEETSPTEPITRKIWTLLRDG